MKRLTTFLFLILFVFALQGQRVLTYGGKVLRAYDANQPLNIDDPCAFWFDGDDDQTFTLDGTSVDQWDDKSGNNRHVLNTNNNATRPTYDASTGRVTFISANSTFLQSAVFGAELSQPNTIFMVFKILIIGDKYFFDGIVLRTAFAELVGAFRIRNTAWLINMGRNSNNNIHVGEFNGANSNYWINGANLVSGNTGVHSLDGITLGTSLLFTQHGDIELMEVIGYNASISATDRDIITAYLADKWSITSTTTHKGYILRY